MHARLRFERHRVGGHYVGGRDGQRAVVERLDAVEQLHQLVVVEDNAQGGQRSGWRGKHPGSQRRLAPQSFEQAGDVLVGKEAFVHVGRAWR